MEIALIKWVDAKTANNGWTNQADLDISIPEVESVGFVIEEDDKKIAILQTVADDGDCFNLFVIPKGVVIDKIVLRKGDN